MPVLAHSFLFLKTAIHHLTGYSQSSGRSKHVARGEVKGFPYGPQLSTTYILSLLHTTVHTLLRLTR